MSAVRRSEAQRDSPGRPPRAAGGGSGWVALAAGVAVVCCAGPTVLAGLGAGLAAGALGAWLRLGVIVVPLLALLAGAGAVWARRRRR